MTVPLLLAALAAQALTPAPQPAVDFTIAAPTPGAWSYRPGAGTTNAVFTDTAGTARLSLSCTRLTRRVTITRTGVAGAAAAMSVWTTSAQRAIAASFNPLTMTLSAELAARDGLLDAIAFSRGRFAVYAVGLAPLVVPASPEAARVFEDCRI